MKKMKMFSLTLMTTVAMVFGVLGATNSIEASGSSRSEPAAREESTTISSPDFEKKDFLKIKDGEVAGSEWVQKIEAADKYSYMLQFSLDSEILSNATEDITVRIEIPEETSFAKEQTVTAFITSSDTKYKEQSCSVTIESDRDFSVARYYSSIDVKLNDDIEVFLDNDIQKELFGKGIGIKEELDGKIDSKLIGNQILLEVPIFTEFRRDFSWDTVVHRTSIFGKTDELEIQCFYTNTGTSTAKNVSVELNDNYGGLVEIVPDSVTLEDDKHPDGIKLKDGTAKAQNSYGYLPENGYSPDPFTALLSDYEPGEKATITYRIRIVKDVEPRYPITFSSEEGDTVITDDIGFSRTCGLATICMVGNEETGNDLVCFPKIGLNEDMTFNAADVILNSFAVTKLKCASVILCILEIVFAIIAVISIRKVISIRRRTKNKESR